MHNSLRAWLHDYTPEDYKVQLPTPNRSSIAFLKGFAAHIGKPNEFFKLEQARAELSKMLALDSVNACKFSLFASNFAMQDLAFLQAVADLPGPFHC